MVPTLSRAVRDGLIHMLKVEHQFKSNVYSRPLQFISVSVVDFSFINPFLLLKVKMELIRQAESLEQVKEILGEGAREAESADAS